MRNRPSSRRAHKKIVERMRTDHAIYADILGALERVLGPVGKKVGFTVADSGALLAGWTGH